MDSSDKRQSLPPVPSCSHRRPFLHRHHHQCLELSPHCQLHGGYLLHPNSHHHHRATAYSHHHHHHHLELSPGCPLHGYLLPYCPLHSSNSYASNQSTTSFPIIPNFAPTIPPPQNPHLSNPNFNNLDSIPPEADADSKSEALLMQEMNEEVEDEEEIIFVLTDEWKEFFAKSEAKRRLEELASVLVSG
ncbi:hypothetical protein L6452_04044 [Arctium lappa]|uniref:Uncharacterized protein n=1 Tax=Arctium lappa TaxID=4217 RepID=A0ACB9FPV0_ARCLA|nr:hypothetical protein L6452_04044 [Arctium lappa]